MASTDTKESTLSDRQAAGEVFPEGAPPAEQLRFLLKYAVLAPSSHNTQPWLFFLRRDSVELYADRTRGLAVCDPDDRELTMSCGCALFNLRLAMWHFGVEDQVDVFPNRNNPDLLARVRIAGRWNPTDEEHRLFEAIARRRTNRRPFVHREVEQEVVRKLQKAAEIEGAWLHMVVGDENRSTLAALIAEGDRVQWADKRFRREVATWVHPNRSMSADGIPGYSMGFNDLMSRAEPVVMRTFDLGGGHAARDLELASGSPLLALLGTQDDTPPDWLAAGQALERVLLQATVEGVSASFLNQPIEVQDLRPVICDFLEWECVPQTVLRMGYGPEPLPTPRRPLNEVVIEL